VRGCRPVAKPPNCKAFALFLFLKYIKHEISDVINMFWSFRRHISNKIFSENIMMGLPAWEDFMGYYKHCGKQVEMGNYNRCWKCPLPSWREALILFIVSLVNLMKVLWSVPATACSMLCLRYSMLLVMAINSLFMEFPWQEVRWCEVRWSWWAKATLDKEIPKEFLYKSRNCLYSQHGSSPYSLQPYFPFIIFQQNNEFGQEL
jgi:hypothetical protein